MDLIPKTNYEVYYKNLEYYLKLGIKVTKVHKILTFDEKPYLKENIDLNTNLRKNCKNDLEKDLFRLMNNAIFGKSMENVLNRSNIKLINNDPEKLLKLIKEPNFENLYEITNKLCLVKSKSIKTKFDKPIYMGSVILETVPLLFVSRQFVSLLLVFNNSSPQLFVSTTIRLHYFSSPLQFVSTTIRLHYYSSPLLFVSTTFRLHYYSSPHNSSLYHLSPTIRLNYYSSPLLFVSRQFVSL